MSTGHVKTVVHFEGDVCSGISSLTYKGDHSKLLYLHRSITHNSLVDKVLHITNSSALDSTPRIRSLLQNDAWHWLMLRTTTMSIWWWRQFFQIQVNIYLCYESSWGQIHVSTSQWNSSTVRSQLDIVFYVYTN